MFQNFLLLVLVGALAWVLVSRLPKRDKHRDSAHGNSAPAKRFSAVSVQPSKSSCQAARSLKGQRFLSKDAPFLPVQGCTAQKCQCIYHHHPDRRTGNGDRRALGSAGSFLLGNSNSNRRSGKGRRKIDTNGDLSWT
jgi:hypothetical protein